jgi:hypothetical protein
VLCRGGWRRHTLFTQKPVRRTVMIVGYEKVKELLCLLIKIRTLEGLKVTLGSKDANPELLNEVKETLKPWLEEKDDV